MRASALLLIALASSPVLHSTPTSIGEQVFPADAFVDAIGVNTHFGFAGGKNEVWAKKFEPLSASIHELGLRYIRGNARLGQKLDRYNQLYKKYGIRTDVTIFQRGLEPDEVIRRSAEWIEALRKTVDPRAVLSFEGANEYNDTREERPEWAAEVCRMQEALFRRIRACPEYADREIIAPSVWYRIHDDYVKLAGTGIARWATRSCAHYYSGGRVPTVFQRHRKFDTGKLAPLTDVISDTRTVVPDRPMWVTETGYGYMPDARDGSVTMSEESVGKYMPRLLAEWFRTGEVERIFIYSLVDDNKPYGLLRPDLSRRPAFHAVKHLLALLADPGPRSEVRPFPCTVEDGSETLHSLVLQKRGGEIDLLLWQDVSSWDLEAKKELNPPAQKVKLTFPRPVSGDIVRPGRAQQAGVPEGAFASRTEISVDVPDEIVVVRIKP